MVGRVEFFEDPYQAALGAHAVVVCTEWREYRELDWGESTRAWRSRHSSSMEGTCLTGVSWRRLAFKCLGSGGGEVAVEGAPVLAEANMACLSCKRSYRAIGLVHWR